MLFYYSSRELNLMSIDDDNNNKRLVFPAYLIIDFTVIKFREKTVLVLLNLSRYPDFDLFSRVNTDF